MRLMIETGETEKHLVVFTWGQFFGTTELTVDGSTVYRGKPLAVEDVSRLVGPAQLLYRTLVSKDWAIGLTRSWDFEIGETERHRLRIDKVRPLLFAGLRPSLFRVYLDDRLVEERVGY